jgi:tetratricopeptide (TPR) repeat protein
MKLVNRLQAITGGFAVAAAIAGTYVAWGDGASRRTTVVRPAVVPGAAVKPVDELVAGRFGSQPVIRYETRAKESLFAWQLKPALDPLPARPRDVILLIDTSASQAGKPLQLATRLAEQLIKDASPVDRVSLWTANTPRTTKSISGGLQNPRAVSLDANLETLRKEFGSGAVDLGGAIRKAARDFEGKKSRQQVIVYLGDGESAYEAITEKERYKLADELVASNISFFAVPVGLKIHSQNIHGISTGTGGAIVRITADEAKPTGGLSEFTARFNKLVNTPVLTDVKIELPDAIAEAFPTKMPPMRADAPTLMVGKLKDVKPANLQAKITGQFGGKEVVLNVSDAVPAPHADHFFLNSLIAQWRESPFKDAPALLRADRALALAYEQNRLAREELLSQAEIAVGTGQYDTAENLYMASLKLDPSEIEAKSGLKVLDRLKKGEITREQIKELAKPKDAQDPMARRNNFQQLANQEVVPAPKGAVPAPAPAAADDLLKQEAARRAVVEQQTRLLVEETLSRARRLLREGDPDGATTAVKQQRDAVKELADIRGDLRDRLVTQMELLLREIETTGQRLKAQRDEANERIARARQKLLDSDEKKQKEDRLRERIGAFTRLMNQARHEDAYREALVLIQESINNGEEPPIEATAVYQIGQSASNLREARELVRLREDRFLMTMLQVEKAHVPYPDEPAVHFPPAKVWRELTSLRNKYSGSDLEAGMPAAVKERFRYLRKSLDNSLPLDKPISTTFGEVVKAIEEIADPTDGKDPSKRIKIIINSDSFKTAKGDQAYKIEEETVTLPAFNGMALSTALRLLTAPFSGTFLVRRDFIELVHQDVILEDKVIRVFEVADLVVPIPQSINQNSLNQQLSILGQTFSLGGQNPLTASNIFNPNAFGGGNQIGVGAGGGGAGQPGGGMMGGFGQLFNGMNVNLGVQGGVQGFGGGALGQFGKVADLVVPSSIH